MYSTYDLFDKKILKGGNMLVEVKVDVLTSNELADVLGGLGPIPAPGACECAGCSKGGNSASLGDLVGAG